MKFNTAAAATAVVYQQTFQ